MDWKSVALFTGVLVAWIALNRWILPRFGVPTCMSGCCGAQRRPTVGEGACSLPGGHERLKDDREHSSAARSD